MFTSAVTKLADSWSSLVLATNKSQSIIYVDSNTIISHSIERREGHEIMNVTLEILPLFISHRYHLKLYRLNNEILKQLETLLKVSFINF